MTRRLDPIGPVFTHQDPSDADWYPEVTIVGNPETAWSDGDDLTYAIANSPSQQQVQSGARGNSPRVEIETAPDITDFTTLTAHVRLRTESNYSGLMPDSFTSSHQFAIEYQDSNASDHYRYTYDSTDQYAQYDIELWPGYYDPERDASLKNQWLSWVQNGHTLNFWSIAGGWQQPTDWWSKCYVSEVWMTVEAPEAQISGRPDLVRRRFVRA